MTHLMEPAAPALPLSTSDHDKHCVFCKEAKEKGSKSFIGDDNDPSKLETNLSNNARPKQPRRTFTHRTHGDYSSEPHHLLPGKEALKKHKLQQWLASRASGSKVKADTGFDINSHLNGVWLPSVPVGFVGVKGWSWRTPSCQNLAIAIMLKENLQFHKGGHTNKGGLDADSSSLTLCYIEKVNERMEDVLQHLLDWREVFCPVVTQQTKGKLPPPFHVNDLIYQYVSYTMYSYVKGKPKTWTRFISRVSYAAHLEDKNRPKPKKRKAAAKKAAAKRRRR